MSVLPQRTSAIWVMAATAISGLSTYVLVVVVARAVGTHRYSEFSLFWTWVVVASLGAFLPLEQLVARRVAGSATAAAALLRPALKLSAWIASGVVLVLAAVWLVAGGSTLTGVCLVICIAGYAVQFVSRGVLAGTRDLRGYAIVVSIDAGVRAVGAVILWAGSVTAVAPYVGVVTLSGTACAMAGALLIRHPGRSAASPADAEVSQDAAATAGPALAAEAIRLTLAASCMQLLLNSAVIVAGTSHGESVAAGRLLAVAVLARVPVFAFQLFQATYVARVAAEAKAGHLAAVGRFVAKLGVVVAACAGLATAVAWLLGPVVVPLIFGASYTVSPGVAALVTAGVGIYLLAAVSNDIAVALGAHRAVAVAWPLGVLAAGAAFALLTGSLEERASWPLIIGGLVAVTLLAPAILRRLAGAPAAAVTEQPSGRVGGVESSARVSAKEVE